MRHLVNAYEVEAGRLRWSLQVTLYDPYLSASEVFHEEALYQVYLPLPLPLPAFAFPAMGTGYKGNGKRKPYYTYGLAAMSTVTIIPVCRCV